MAPNIQPVHMFTHWHRVSQETNPVKTLLVMSVTRTNIKIIYRLMVVENRVLRRIFGPKREEVA
jgi:hypothetical protein